MNDKNRATKQKDIDQAIENDAQNEIKQPADIATIQKEDHEKAEEMSENEMNNYKLELDR